MTRTPPRPRIRDLDRLPYADHRLVPLARYHEPFIEGPIGAMITARGCPHRCTFCVKPYGDEPIGRSLGHLLGEVDALAALGVRHLRFLDDTWTLSRPRAMALCEALAGRHPGLRWTCLTRLDSLDADLARAMASAGCQRIYAGVESADPARLAAWRKGVTPDALIRGARAARAAGIELSGFFIVGAPGDGPADVSASVDLARRLDLDFVIATRLQVWPGTPLHDATFGGGPGPADGALPDADWTLERAFYRDFYLHPRGWPRQLRRLHRAPIETARGALAVARYVARPHRRDLI